VRCQSTDTELKLIAALATIGGSAPAAIGISI
jgi:hypothetical protein